MGITPTAVMDAGADISHPASRIIIIMALSMRGTEAMNGLMMVTAAISVVTKVTLIMSMASPDIDQRCRMIKPCNPSSVASSTASPGFRGSLR
jgi:hypothetical protein